jgi:hypothetical protein
MDASGKWTESKFQTVRFARVNSHFDWRQIDQFNHLIIRLIR